MLLTTLLVLSASDDVFVSGALKPDEPYAVYRIPAIAVTRKGTVLAFAEGRKTTGDQSSNDLVLRRQERGKAWGPLHVLADEGEDSLNNPCVTVDRAGRIWLMFQRYPKGVSEYRAPTGREGEGICRTYEMHSDDDGRSWSKPRDLTRELKPGWSRTVASGPGLGLELQRGRYRGRLVVPFNMGDASGWRVYAAISDDRGATWRMGDMAPRLPGTHPNEVQFVELADGRLMLNARNQASLRQRLVAVSDDGGTTWSTPTPDPNLIDPVCMGAIVRAAPGVLAFSNPNHPQQRVNGTLRFSFDEGKTWPKTVTITEGPFAYSVLAPLPDGQLGCLYEVPDGGAYRIRLSRFPIPRPE